MANRDFTHSEALDVLSAYEGRSTAHLALSRVSPCEFTPDGPCTGGPSLTRRELRELLSGYTEEINDGR